MALTRRLKDYRWELRGHKIALVNLRQNKDFELDKVRLMSFLKFGINCLDSMRIEGMKLLRKKARDTRLQNRIKREQAIQRQQALFAKAGIKNKHG